MSRDGLTVSEALALAKDAIDAGVGPLRVDGELSGFKRHRPSGHLYFDLKDARSRLSCVMWREAARRLRFEPADGMLVRAQGRFGIYEVQGRLQLYAEALEPAGLGDLHAALERLKERLAAEGLFATERKRPLPRFPERIGVATSDSGAAIRDILRVLGQRWPVAEVVLRPCAVQGAAAAPEIAAALEDLGREPDLDLILLGRGGGSIEDLWCFNDEAVVRAVAGSRRPVVAGIGHEIDVTLADLAADLRAATPSQAAELSVPDRTDVLARLRGEGRRLLARAEGRLRTERLRVARIESSHGLRRPRELVRTRAQRIDELAIRLESALANGIARRRTRLEDLDRRFRSREPRLRLRRGGERLAEIRSRIRARAARAIADRRRLLALRAEHLEAVGPRSVLGRGYAICLREADGGAIRSWTEVGDRERVAVILGTGSLRCRVEERRETWDRNREESR